MQSCRQPYHGQLPQCADTIPCVSSTPKICMNTHSKKNEIKLVVLLSQNSLNIIRSEDPHLLTVLIHILHPLTPRVILGIIVPLFTMFPNGVQHGRTHSSRNRGVQIINKNMIQSSAKRKG